MRVFDLLSPFLFLRRPAYAAARRSLAHFGQRSVLRERARVLGDKTLERVVAR